MMLSLCIAANATAATVEEKVDAIAKPETVKLDDVDKYEAKTEGDYKGRNENISRTKEISKRTSGSALTRSVIITKSSKDSQLENLESTAGELVQKVEDDRLKKSKEHKDVFDSTKATLQQAYDFTREINENMLGNEQDPKVQNAFKCSNLRNCDTSENDDHAIKECNEGQRLSWSGKEWSCIGMFADPGKPNCGSDQWDHPVNGGIACVDYVYIWTKTGVGTCRSDDKAPHVYECIQKKNKTDKSGTPVAAGNCFGETPTGVDSCTYEGVWTAGGWGGCSRSCGSGVQTRSVTCTQTYCKPETKPVAQRSCNTQRCPIAPYNCPAVYGAGWYPSGANCVKSSYACTYSSSSRCIKSRSQGCKGNVGSQNVYALYNGTRVYNAGGYNSTVNSFPSSFVYGGVRYKCGSFRDDDDSSRSCGSRHGSARSYYNYYEVCRENVQYRTICPGGWRYSGGQCH